MLNRFENGVMKISCCEEYDYDITNLTLRWSEEFNEYENLVTPPCPKCGSVEIFNMNLPTNERDLDFETIEKLYIPNEEVNQRKYVVDIINYLTKKDDDTND